MKNRFLLPLLLLAGCTVVQTGTVYKARTSLIGISAVDLERCAGIPDQVSVLHEQTPPDRYDEVLLQWNSNITGNSGSSSFTVGLPFGTTAKFGALTGQCHFHASVFRDGTVSDVSFSGPLLADAASVCSGLVSECMVHPSATTPPAGYDAFAAFLPSASAKSAKPGH
jgi:hypothetical protein